MTRQHELKTWPPYFDRILDGTKTFEVRREEGRDFHVGDVLWLREHNGIIYTGRSIFKRVAFMFRWDDDDLGTIMLSEDVVVMGLSPMRSDVEIRMEAR